MNFVCVHSSDPDLMACMPAPDPGSLVALGMVALWIAFWFALGRWWLR